MRSTCTDYLSRILRVVCEDLPMCSIGTVNKLNNMAFQRGSHNALFWNSLTWPGIDGIIDFDWVLRLKTALWECYKHAQ